MLLNRLSLVVCRLSFVIWSTVVFRLLLVCCLGVVFGGLSRAQSWEKVLAPGLSYRMQVDTKTPRVVHAMRWSLGAPELSAKSEVAQLKLFPGLPEASRQEMSRLSQQAGAIAAVNSDFFGVAGEPLGAMVRDGEMLSRPFPGRAAFGWSNTGHTEFATMDWACSAFFENMGRQPITGFNEDVPANGFVLFTDASKEARCVTPNAFVVMKFEKPKWAPTGLERGVVVDVVLNKESMEIPKGHAVLVGGSSVAPLLASVKKLEKVTISMRTDGMEWEKITNVAGGGPNLLSVGQPKIDWEEASFSKSFSETRHPRTAVGRTKENDLWFVVVDGRQPMSSGASLTELAQIMKDLGCTEAINLDGGGSSTLSIFGEVLNRPSDGRERRVSNGILFFGPTAPKSTEPFVIQGPPTLAPGAVTPYQLIGPNGQPVPDREVLWSAMGPGGWVDQGGNVRALSAGDIQLRAHCRGVVVTLVVKVAAVPTQTPPTPKS